MIDATITINDVVISQGQTLTLRMALAALKLDLHDAEHDSKLGPQSIAEHLKHLDELTELVGDIET